MGENGSCKHIWKICMERRYLEGEKDKNEFNMVK